jgi:hypothetical protein
VTKTCMNCEHRRGESFRYAQCVRTGFYCTTELNFGGRCAGPIDGTPQLNLWEPRQAHKPEGSMSKLKPYVVAILILVWLGSMWKFAWGGA